MRSMHPAQTLRPISEKTAASRRRELANYWFIVPIFLLFATFIVYPIIYNFILSGYDWNGVSLTRKAVGLKNYAATLRDPVFFKILKNFAVFGFSTIVIQALLAMVFASFFINRIWGSSLYRILIYLPVVVTPTIIGHVFSRFFEANYGMLNTFLRSVGLSGLTRTWLADPSLALGCLIFVNIWQWTGYSMLLYYASMLNISEDLYEAASIDGAGKVGQFFRITLPLLRSTHFTVFILGALGSLKCYDIAYVLTGGGPNHATETFSTYIQEFAFSTFKQGRASTLVVFMFLIAMVITAAQLILYYRGDQEKEMNL